MVWCGVWCGGSDCVRMHKQVSDVSDHGAKRWSGCKCKEHGTEVEAINSSASALCC